MRGDRRIRHRSGPHGQALVEFALVFPIVILIIVALFDIGRAVFIYNGLTNAAREGARLAMVNQDEGLIGQRVQDMAFGTSVSNLGDPDLVNFRKEDLDDGTTTDVECPAVVTGCVAVVTTRADWTAITPIIGALIGPISLEAQSELAVEFVCPNPPYYPDSASCPKQP